MAAGYDVEAIGSTRTWSGARAALLAPRAGAPLAVAGFAPVLANVGGVLLLNAGDALLGEAGPADRVNLEAGFLAEAARAAGLDAARPFAQPWLRLHTDEFLRLRLLLRGAPDAAGMAAWLQRLLRGAPAEWRRRPLPHAGALEQRGRFELAQAVCGFLDRHWRRNVSLAELESEFGLGSFHLLRVFRRETGLTPHRYALQLRLRRVLLELEQAPPRLGELAQRAGFASHAHFSRAFRAAWGLSPRDYAANFPAPRAPGYNPPPLPASFQVHA